MKFRASHGVPMFFRPNHPNYLHNQPCCFAPLLKRLHKTTKARAFSNGGGRGPKGDSFLLPGATVATLLMLGVLHVRRMYDDRKSEEAREKGTEFEFQPDVKSTFLKLLPLRSISRCWGLLTSVVGAFCSAILVGAFNMGSTVVLVFQAPISVSQENGDSSSEFRFSVQRGDRVLVGEALGRWHDQ